MTAARILHCYVGKGNKRDFPATTAKSLTNQTLSKQPGTAMFPTNLGRVIQLLFRPYDK